MKVCYKRLWKLLIDKDMKKKDLCEKAGISPGYCQKTTSFRLAFIPPVTHREPLCSEDTTSIWMMLWPGTTARNGKQYTPNRTMTSSSLGEVFIFDMIFGPTRFLHFYRL